MIKRACRLEVENLVLDNGQLTDVERSRQIQQKQEQVAYDAFQSVLEEDPNGSRRLKGVLDVMILEGRYSDQLDTSDSELVNNVLKATDKDNVVFGVSEPAAGIFFATPGHTRVRRRIMRLETAAIRRRLNGESEIEGFSERLEKLAEIRALLALRAIADDYIETTNDTMSMEEVKTVAEEQAYREDDFLTQLEARLEAERIHTSELATAV